MCTSKNMHTYMHIFLSRLLYDENFGGVTSFKGKDFELVNGMSNLYWGWGGEDDDLYRR